VLGIAGRSGGGIALERGAPPIRVIRAEIALAAIGLATIAVSGSLLIAIGGLVATGVGVGLPYAAVFNGAAASVPDSPASTQGFVGMGGVVTAIVGPPLVGRLLDVGGGFTSGFLAISAFAVVVLIATSGLRPFSFGQRLTGSTEQVS
jgi:nitrate/nitrite transporter NarK